MNQSPTIIYTHTDEAPALATYAFLPVIEAFAKTAGVAVEIRDISLAGRIIATFPENLTAEQRISDALAELGELALAQQVPVAAPAPRVRDGARYLWLLPWRRRRWGSVGGGRQRDHGRCCWLVAAA